MSESGDGVRGSGRASRVLPLFAAIVGACAIAGTIAGFAALDHCGGVACDFRTTFYPQGAALLAPSFSIAPFWRLPPFAALAFAPFAALSPGAAVRLWEALNVALALALATLCGRELEGRGRPARWLIAAALVASSLPVLHDLKWGQVSLLVCVGAIAALRSRRAEALGLGLLAAFKVYPIAYALAPLAERRWRTVVVAASFAVGIGGLLPLALLGPDRTVALAANLLARAGGSGGWEEGHSIAYYGGQSLAPSIERWLCDGRHVGPDEGSASSLAPAAGLIASWPAPVASAVAVLASVAVLGATASRLSARRLSPAHAAALCLTAVTLVAPPGWHHYFAFLPYAQAVALGTARSPRVTALAIGSWLASALPLILLGLVDRAYFEYSAWGGTTLSALLAWLALLGLPDRGEAPRSTPVYRTSPA